MTTPLLAEAISRLPDGVRIRVRLTPKSARDAIEGEERLADGSAVIVARVRAVPEAGRANAALEHLLAKAVDVARSRVSVVSGATLRVKIVEIVGDPDSIAAHLKDAFSARAC